MSNRTIKAELKLRDEAKKIYKAAKQAGHVAALLTQERPNLFTQSVANIERGVLNILRHLKMIEGIPRPAEHAVYLDPTEVLTSPATGILYWHVERGHTVAQGALLAHITNFFGERIGEVRAPFDGEVLYVVATPPITKGQPVAFIGARKK